MPYPVTKTFWLEPTDTLAWGLRRYSSGGGLTCAAGHHSALVYLGRATAVFDDRGFPLPHQSGTSRADPRWPAACELGCGYRFISEDRWQDWAELIYARPDTGQEYVLHSDASAEAVGAPSAPPGACWDASWMPARFRGPDGLCLTVRLPNGHDWMVDGEAGNCTRKGQPHQCWVRHGDPRQAGVTVDKNGNTCSAGAGSIAARDYHGFLRGGVLTAG